MFLEIEEFGKIKLTFGRYKGRAINSVPDSYLKFLLKNNIISGKLLIYSKSKLKHPKYKFEVTVKDSVNSKDGTYNVEAYTKNQAIQECINLENIECSQSNHGTLFCTTLIDKL